VVSVSGRDTEEVASMPKKRRPRQQRRPHVLIPNTYVHVPMHGLPDEGLVSGDASYAELQAAGFHGGPEAPPVRRSPGTPPISELVVPGEVVQVSAATLLAEAKFRALRDRDSRIVATWDEGHWWTPSESVAFTAALLRGTGRSK
jgi:hypothetical protein